MKFTRWKMLHVWVRYNVCKLYFTLAHEETKMCDNAGVGVRFCGNIHVQIRLWIYWLWEPDQKKMCDNAEMCTAVAITKEANWLEDHILPSVVWKKKEEPMYECMVESDPP